MTALARIAELRTRYPLAAPGEHIETQREALYKRKAAPSGA